ncbi:hypothetical protein BKA61DRAFT_575007 [Leptodontidium sp. MPI-SDFR-AT-0119]|nr:hypothetical protein BKA61DRAFT_575007 [Leptodontidium sp. MPI-SDFR-AT-0119]
MPEPNSSFWKRSVGRFGKSKGDLSSGGSASGEASSSAATTFRFVEDGGKSKSTEGEAEESDLTPKQRRRAQVRKAQIEHRQRKENHVKHLEKEVIDLREKIAQAETQAVLFKHENIAIKTALQNSLVQLPVHLQTTSSPATSAEVHSSQYQNQSPEQDQSMVPNTDQNFDMDLSGPDDIFNLTSPSSIAWREKNTLVYTTFDPFLDEECLQISPAGSTNFPLSIDSTSNSSNNIFGNNNINAVSLPSPDMFNSANWKPAVLAQQEREKIQQKEREGEQGGMIVDGGNSSRKLTPEEEMEMLAINFILALEHPCRTHFSPPSSAPYDPTSNETGHELMATTHLFSHASSFTRPNPYPHAHPALSTHPSHLNLNPHHDRRPALHEGGGGGGRSNPHPTIGAPGSTWYVPPPNLQDLYQMSESLPKENWEITPVQAWFLLVGRYGWERLLRVNGSPDGGGGGGEREAGRERGEKVMDSLKRGLAKLVSCLHFGSVMDEAGFWEVVGSVLGEDGGVEWV